MAAAVIGAGPGPAMAATDTQSSTVEDGNYPGAAAIEATENIHLISGDGHIVLADCATAPVDGIGVMRVDTTDVVGPDGAGEVCFKVTASSGVLNLTLPAVYSIRGDGYPAFSGNGHNGTAVVTTDDGVQTTVTLKPDQSTQVGISADPPGPPTTLLRLSVGAGLAPVTGTNPAIGKLDAGGRGCTATLIRSDWIVTAASCFADNPDQPSVPAGAPARSTHVVFPGHDPVAVTLLVPRGDRDMVMGKLDTAIGGITPVKLSNVAPVTNGTLQEAGYGRTATVWAPDAQQTATVTATGATGTAVTGNVTGGLVCKGDAGSPAFNEQGQVVAINSRAGQAGCLDASSTDTEVTDTRLDNIVDWMRLNTFETTVSPALSTESDGWHVDASLPGVNRFEFVVKTASQADAYYGDQTSPFVIPLSYTGKAVFVGARAEGSGTPWAAGVTETVPAAVPKLAVEPDGWHVDASLPGVDHFMFVVKVAGQPDVYTDNQTSPFLVDPSTYGGKSVSVSARAAGPATNPWGAAVTDVVPAAVPKLTVEPDGWHVDASLPGVDHFVFVVKVAGQPDVYTDNLASPFLVDPSTYGGRSVSVSARAAGPATNPWGAAVTEVVPAAPKLAVESDGWHVDASLPGVDHFMFVVKVAGQPDVYIGNQTSPFLVDPSTYGGRSVSVSARAEGPATNPWGAAVTDVVPAAVPKLAVESDGWHVDASLPGVDHFVFVVKVAGQPDVYTDNLTSPFLVDPWVYGGRSVSVSARAAGPASNPWGSAVAFTVTA